MIVTREDILSAAEIAGMSADLSGLKGTDSLSDAGLDSLEIMTFFLGLEEKFDVKFPDDDVDELNTIDSIIDYMGKM